MKGWHCALRQDRPRPFLQGWNMGLLLFVRMWWLCPWVLVPDCLSSNLPIPAQASYPTSLGPNFPIYKMG